MTITKLIIAKAATVTSLAAICAIGTSSVSAQQPPRPNESPRTVTLALTEYNRLIDLANRPSQGPAPPPVAAVLESADLRVRVERDTVRGVFNVAGDVLRAGYSRVNVLSGTTLVDATAAGRPTPLIAEGNAYTALLQGPGPFSLALDWGAPLKFAPGRASFVLPVPPAGTARGVFDLPGDQADIHLSSGLVTRRSTENGRTIVETTLDPGSSTEVWWSMRDSATVAAARDVRALADITTLLTLGDSDVRLAALVDVTVVQGEPRSFELRLPPGYELTGVSGSSLESSEPHDNTVVLAVGDPAARHHQFLIGLERSHEPGSFSLTTGFPTMPNAQRERGEVAIEGTGALELSAAERDGLHRIDVREASKSLQLLAHSSVLSAFRYQRSAGTPPSLELDVKRFADAGVLAAVADHAVATTLITKEGRALTEVSLRVQNHAQPFMKVELPPGASIVSVQVAGEAAKPVVGADGMRVPLLRAGFRPVGPYAVSFVYTSAGQAFTQKGDVRMTLPKMDVPVGLVEWEVFVPENYSARVVGGNVIDQGSGAGSGTGHGSGVGVGIGTVGAVAGSAVDAVQRHAGIAGGFYIPEVTKGLAGEIRGRVVDESGAVLPGVAIVVADGTGANRTFVTGSDGTFVIPGVSSGVVTVSAELAGFQPARRSFAFDEQPRQVDFTMRIGGVAETLTVTAAVPVGNARSKSPANSPTTSPATSMAHTDGEKGQRLKQADQPSQNVLDLQRRAAGVLPVRFDIPRAGTSHQLVKPLVVDQEVSVDFAYKRR